MDNVRDTFAARLTSLREAIGTTQEAFAQVVGMSRQTIRAYERGDRTPTVENLDQLTRVTGCSVEYLMGRSENMRPSGFDLVKETGLSDGAIDTLRKLTKDNPAAGATISAFIEQKAFPVIIGEIERMAFYESKQELRELGVDLSALSAHKVSCVAEDMARELARNPSVQKGISEIERAVALPADAQRKIRAAYDQAFDALIKWAGPPANSPGETIEAALALAQSFADERRHDEEEKQKAATDKLTAFRRRMEGKDL